MEAQEVPKFVETIVEHTDSEFIGMSDDGKRFGIKCNRVGKLATKTALKNGYAVEEVAGSTMNSEYENQVTFSRLGF